jgi:hypothetical protein
VVNKDAKKSKYSGVVWQRPLSVKLCSYLVCRTGEVADPSWYDLADTLHRFCKKEHDWGWKKFMEISKVFEGFTVSDTLVIKAQVQVIRCAIGVFCSSRRGVGTGNERFDTDSYNGRDIRGHDFCRRFSILWV